MYAENVTYPNPPCLFLLPRSRLSTDIGMSLQSDLSNTIDLGIKYTSFDNSKLATEFD